MKFYTAEDVLEQTRPADPREPTVIEHDATIQEALVIMFNNDFSQIPVIDDDEVTGAVSYRSIARALKAVTEVDIRQQVVGTAIEEPVFVEPSRDVYTILETLAVDDYVLVGEPARLVGLLTRYDVLLFLEREVEPFLLIGEIEVGLRSVFESTYDDPDETIAETFASRAERDEYFRSPESVADFTFEHYKMFLTQNWDEVGGRFSGDQDFVIELVSEVQQVRNALFHFRAGSHQVDRDLLSIAHAQLTAPLSRQ